MFTHNAKDAIPVPFSREKRKRRKRLGLQQNQKTTKRNRRGIAAAYPLNISRDLYWKFRKICITG
jgi:hypothetical protein